MERNNPSTSHEAYSQVSKEMIHSHWSKIIDAIRILGSPIYEEIASYCNFPDKNMVSRRLKELESEGIIYKPGTKKPTRSNRMAFQYALTGKDVQVTIFTLPEKYTKGEQSAADIACSIIAKAPKGISQQQQLFID